MLAHDPLAVALLILHIEWMTQRTTSTACKDDQDLDPQFKSLLKHHWMEEAQHAKLDTLMVEALAAGRCDRRRSRRRSTSTSRSAASSTAGSRSRSSSTSTAFTRATGRRLDDDGAGAVRRRRSVQANRWTYLGSGMTHPNFLETVEMLDPALRRRLEEIAPTFC